MTLLAQRGVPHHRIRTSILVLAQRFPRELIGGFRENQSLRARSLLSDETSR
jgi:hypothetical protein